MAWSEWASGIEVEPSLYAADFANLGSQIRELLDAGARIFHFDMGDGYFIEPVTIGPIVIESIAPIVHSGGGILDCHLMVENPERHFRQVAEAGGDSVTFHVEATADPQGAVRLARDLGLGVGVALNPETPSRAGYSGQEFMPEAFDRIRALRAALPDDVHVQVDGGVKPANAPDVQSAGAELLVIGSGIFAENRPGRAYEMLSARLAGTPAVSAS